MHIQSSEHSVIPYPKIAHLRYYIASILYRNPHIHKAYELLFILQGSVNIQTSSKRIVAEQGDIVVLNSNEVHELVSNNGPVLLFCAQISTYFCKEYFPSLSRTEFLDNHVKKFLDPDNKQLLVKLLLAAGNSYWKMDSMDIYQCVSLTSIVLGILINNIPNREISPNEYTSRSQKAERIRRITTYIEEHYAEPRLLSKLANQEGITPTYMSHFFSETFHITFQKYLKHVRLEKAMHLLFSTNYSILDVCYACGFTDYKQLNHFCWNEFGQSASSCRNINLVDKSQSPSPANTQMIQYLYKDHESLDYIASLDIPQPNYWTTQI